MKLAAAKDLIKRLAEWPTMKELRMIRGRLRSFDEFINEARRLLAPPIAKSRKERYAALRKPTTCRKCGRLRNSRAAAEVCAWRDRHPEICPWCHLNWHEYNITGWWPYEGELPENRIKRDPKCRVHGTGNFSTTDVHACSCHYCDCAFMKRQMRHREVPEREAG
jgi:hypothetical protein